MTSGIFEVKEWIINKAQIEAKRFNTWIDKPERDQNHEPVVSEDGFIKVIAEEVLQESEKAVKVRLSSGSVVGSGNGWTLWIPKSQIRA